MLFIDYKKAFDTIDSNLLLLKLFHYGFSNSALRLVSDYFVDRSQKTKLNGITSPPNKLNLGVAQGSVLGPLFFLIFINDLPYLLKQVMCKLFADDTSLYKSNKDIDELIKDFNKSIQPLSEWCTFNRLDINWSKTFCMFITNKNIKKPKELLINGKTVKVVEDFKLLGVNLDSKLTFAKHTSMICLQINKKLFSIKRLFYLATSVKVQFF